jgi:hypothetical protein
VQGVRRVFYNYLARGVPNGPDDGTISPWAAAASLPFAPEIVTGTIRYLIEKLGEKGLSEYGFDASYNSIFSEESNNVYTGWVSPWVFGLNQGSTIVMIENYQSALIWKTMSKCSYLVDGLRAAGFESGWLDKV